MNPGHRRRSDTVMGRSLHTGGTYWGLQRPLLVAIFVVITWYGQCAWGSEPETKVTTQCFRRHGISFVSLYCGFGKVVRVKEAFHGAHRSHSATCGHEEGDCHVNTESYYDWSRCESRNSCVQLVQHIDSTPTCGGLRPVYLQVTYTCVDGKATSMKPLPPVLSQTKVAVNKATMTQLPVRKATPEMTIKAANICLNKTVHLSELYIQSPGYPEFYPGGLDCRCEVRASAENSITVRFDEIKLAPVQASGTNNGVSGIKEGDGGVTALCDDWLMLEAPQYKGAGVVVCQDVDSRRRSLQSRSSHIILHLHTTHGLGVRARRGFRILITGSSKEMLEIDCYQTSAEIALASVPPGAASADPSRPYALPPTNFGSSESYQNAAYRPDVVLTTMMLGLCATFCWNMNS